MEEIWRVQAFNNCAVGFRIRDTTYGPHWLVGAEAREARTRMREPVSKGWTYTMSGFRRGDTVTIVLPNVFCGDITISSIEGSLSPPKPPIKLEVR